MKLTTTTNVSVDSVMQGAGPDEDRRGGFEHGGWAMPLSTTRPRRLCTRSTSAPTRSCFGRRTYEIFAGDGE
jgi:hypothetical protein